MIYAFDEYELDTRLYELRRAGALVQLEPKVFDLLAYLVEHGDRIVPKPELLAHLWPSQFISDATFDHCVMAARRVVGDDGQRQRVIKTMRGRGYRFVATLVVATLGEPANDMPGAASAPAPQTLPVSPEAARHLNEALTTFAAMSAHFEVGRTHLALAELAQRQSNREAATLHVTEAHHLFTTLGVPAYVRRTVQYASRCGLVCAAPAALLAGGA